jgi:hypothetical protein
MTLLVSSSGQAVVTRMQGRGADSKNRIKELKDHFGATAGPVHYCLQMTAVLNHNCSESNLTTAIRLRDNRASTESFAIASRGATAIARRTNCISNARLQ